MKRRFLGLSFQYKIILALLLMINLSFLATGYLAKTFIESTLMEGKEAKLLALAQVLNARLGDGGYKAILEKHGAASAPRDEQIAVLNAALRAQTDEVAESVPGLGVGYYSRALEAIVTYGPSESFGKSVGVRIPDDHPGRLVMRLNRPMVKIGTMVRGDIMNAMCPIERDGEVIGYIWANELTDDIMSQFAAMNRRLIVFMTACFLATMGLLLLLSRRTMKGIENIMSGVKAMRSDLSARIEDNGGDLGEVAASINAMAEDIEKANTETGRAITVLQSIMSNVDAAIYVCDPATKRLVYANEYLHELLGDDSLAGELCYKVLHGREAPCLFCPQKFLFDATGAPILTPYQWENHHALSGRDFLVTDRMVTWHDGRLLHMEVATDVTERNALAMAESANLAQRDFLARMSHEIRTPMNGVLGMTRIAMQASPPPAQMEYLKKIESSAALLLGIINDILDFSRIEAGKLTVEKHVFRLPDLVENIRELITPRIKENNLDLIINVDASVPEYAEGDGLRLSQVLLNLLGNASKFTLDGFVRLDMRATPNEDGRLRLDCAVSDSGIGMDEEQQRALFKPFSQADSSTSRRFGGTGLGLSICKALVELMDGSISAKSRAGEGSAFVFHIVLDKASGPDRREAAHDAPWETASYKGYSFLVVEDNLINQEIAEAVLTDLGAKVTLVNNGEEGVRAFESADYDLILMDVRMPVMDGLEATRRIRASAKHDARSVPVVAMTANAMQEDRQASQEAGMDDHVAKPIDMNELRRVLFRRLHGGGSASGS